jgi:hypothetical protein
MGIGAAIFLLAAGAVLTFAINATVNGVDLDAVGVILMVAGAVGVVIALVASRRAGRDRVVATDVYRR